MKTFVSILIIVSGLVACNDVSKNIGSGLAISTEPLDTLQAPATPSTAAPLLFENAYIKGSTARINKATLIVRRYECVE